MSERRYVAAPHGQIHLRIAEPESAPTAPPLICLHPSPISSLVYETFLPVMATDRRVIAIDTPGYGMSDPLDGTASIERFAAAMWVAIDAVVGDEVVDLFGYHTGSATAMEVALARPERVRKIVINSALMFSDEERVEFAAHFKARDERLPAEKAETLPTAWTGWRAHWRDVPDDYLGWRMFMESQRLPVGQANGFFAAFAHDFPAAFKRVTHPIMILNPSDDLYEMTLRIEPILTPNAFIRPLPGWTHGFLDAWPQEIAAIMRSYLTPES